MKTVILTTVYPGIEPYLYDFFNSLSSQTEGDFDLLVLNNGIQKIGDHIKNYNISIEEFSLEGSPAYIRKAGIDWAVSNGAEIIIFADADDYFSENRVGLSRELLLHNDIVFNELILFGENLKDPIQMLNKHFQNKRKIGANEIKNSNCLGLSNTAIKVEKISSQFHEIPNNIIAFDWIFFALCLHAGAEAIFTPNAQTYYRQYENNIASPNNLSDEQILRGVAVKKDHYKLLSQFYPEYISLSKEFNELIKLLSSDPELKKNYIEAIRNQYTNIPLWWEPIKTLKELGL